MVPVRLLRLALSQTSARFSLVKAAVRQARCLPESMKITNACKIGASAFRRTAWSI